MRTLLTSGSEPSLQNAAAQAVAQSLGEAAMLRERTLELANSLRRCAERGRSRCRILLPSGDDSEWGWNADDWVERIKVLFERQMEILQTFNIALFGRTGAGKSTVIEAMTRGDGATVSPDGRCDYTRYVTPRLWEGCKLYDTPGINGWGASESRESLETKARRAVEVADFVLVCYDTQAQQQEEFRKLKDWVKTYNKPVIAILNVRSERWRLPEKISSAQQRRNLSTQPAQHAEHISAEMARTGIFDVPVIAMSSKRALIARAMLPWRGPVPEEFVSMRERLGVERLLRSSNFGALESLITAAISDHAAALRMGVLSDQVRGELGRLDEDLTGEIAACRQAAELAEKQVMEMLRLFGYPRDPEKLGWFDHERAGLNLLSAVEKLRGGKFTAPTRGTYEEYVRGKTREGTELGVMRKASLRRADELIEEAFQQRKEVDKKEFNHRCFDGAAIKAASEQVMDAADSFLRRRVEIASADFEADLEAIPLEADISADGKCGQVAKIAGVATKVGGILTGTGSAVLFTIAGANIWNPVGWTAIGLAIGSALLTLGGKWFTRWAERERLRKRGEAKGNARAAVHTTYNHFQRELEKAARGMLCKNSGPLLADPLAGYLSLLHRIGTGESMRNSIARFLHDLPPRAHPQARLVESMRATEETAFPGQPDQSRLLWLGEDWIKDPTNLREDVRAERKVVTGVNDPGLLERLSSAVGRFFQQQQFAQIPGREWFGRVLQVCEEEGEDLGAFSDLVALRESGKPRIFLVGDYNAGKSSFIKRLLIDSGQPVPESLKIRADPTTAEVSVIPWEGVELVDTPGFQSGNPEHAERTLQTFSAASLIFYLFPPNLILGDETPIRRVLNGDAELGMRPKRDRTLFLINRADELGCDPDMDRQFAIRVRAKSDELSRTLQARGVDVPPDRISCIAADPYGMMGDRSDAGSEVYNPYRHWDGIHSFFRAFRRLKPELLVNGVDRSLIEGGIHRLTCIILGYRTAVEKKCERRDFGDSLTDQLRKAREEGETLAAKHRAKAERIIELYANDLIDRCLAAQSEKEIQEKRQLLHEWWKDADLMKSLEDWGKETAERFQEWTEEVEDRLDRLVNSREFAKAFSAPEMEGYKYQGPNETANRVAKGALKSGEMATKLGRDGVYAIGKAVGYKFRPWEAVKIGKTLGKASIVLVWIGVGIDIWDLIHSGQLEKKRETERRRMTESVRKNAPKVTRIVTHGPEEEPDTGVIAAFESFLHTFDERIADLGSEHDCLEAEIATADQTIARYQSLLAEAENILARTSSS